MDFASLKAELAKSKRALESTTDASKKYIRRGDMEKQRELAYLQTQAQLDMERQSKQEEKIKKMAATAATAATAAKGKNHAESDIKKEENDSYFRIPVEEIIKRFRLKGQPIRLFGETERQRTLRLKNLESKEESEGQQNDFMKKITELETDLDLEALKRKSAESSDSAEIMRKKLLEEQKQLIRVTADKTELISLELLKTNRDKTHHLLSLYYKRLLREWEEQLDSRSDDVQRSMQGKMASATQQQSLDYLKPFFQKLKSQTLPTDVLEHIVQISNYMQKREYVKANDVYLRLSIGNAPWPIGVTMVGIHERSAREKIHSNQVAHVLNDETQRKWIQSIKRLMTFCQTKYPPSDLSKAIG